MTSMFEKPDAEVESLPESMLDAVSRSDRTLWGALRRLIWPDAKERGARAAHRLRMLSYAIEYAPDSPTNYVLRGEVYLETGAADLAYDDFKRALELAAGQLEKSDWGLLAQAMQDRAEAGLAAAEKRMRVSPS